jgi:small subunit ribosomal protein S18
MQQRRPRRTRVCEICSLKLKRLDYKNIEFLEQYVDDGSRLRSRRRTRTCARHQRVVTQAVKQARHVGLLSFTAAQHRGQG